VNSRGIAHPGDGSAIRSRNQADPRLDADTCSQQDNVLWNAANRAWLTSI